MLRIRRSLLTLVLTLIPLAHAQTSTLEALAPAETILALGLQGGSLPGATLEEAFADLDVAAARDALDQIVNVLGSVDVPLDLDMPLEIDPFGGMGDDALGEIAGELDQECPGIADAANDLIALDWASDLLLTVSADRFSPLPGILALARVDASAMAEADALGALILDCFAGDVLGEEGGTDMVVLFDGSDLPLVVAQRDSLFVIGSRPDLVRGALRRDAGADEPSLADHPAATLAGEGPGARLLWNAAGIAGVLESLLPFPPDEATGAAIDRGTRVLRTLGFGGARITVDDAGLTLDGVFQPNAAGGDLTLYELISCSDCSLPDPVSVPAGTVSASASTLRASAWLDWLDELLSDVGSTFGVPVTVRDLARDFVGVDLDTLLVGWLGGDTLTTRLATDFNQLDTLIYGAPTITSVAVTSEEAARAGIESLLTDVPALLSMLDLDAMLDGAGDLTVDTVVRDVTIAGVPAWRIQSGPTLDLAIAVHAGRLWFASPSSALATAVGPSEDAMQRAGWSAIENVPGTRIGWSLSNPASDLEGIANLLDTLAQPLASLAQFGITAALDQTAGFDDDFDDFGGFGGEPEAVIEDIATIFPFGGPEGLLEAPRSILPLDEPQSGALGTFALEGIVQDVWELPSLPDGTVASVVVTSMAFDTYLSLYDATTGDELTWNDDAPDVSRSEILFRTDGRPLLVAVSSFSGDAVGSYDLEFRLSDAEERSAGADIPPFMIDLADVRPTFGPDGLLDAPRSNLPFDAPQPGDLGSHVLGDEYEDVWKLPSIPAGSAASVVVRSDAFDTYLYLYDATTGEELAWNDDAPDMTQSEIAFLSDGRSLLVGVNSFFGDEVGPYTLTLRSIDASSATEGMESNVTPDVDADVDEAGVPSFGSLLALTEFLPDAVRVLAERTGEGWGVVTQDDGTIRNTRRVTFDW